MLITERTLQAAKLGTIAVHVPGCPGLQGVHTVLQSLDSLLRDIRHHAVQVHNLAACRVKWYRMCDEKHCYKVLISPKATTEVGQNMPHFRHNNARIERVSAVQGQQATQQLPRFSAYFCLCTNFSSRYGCRSCSDSIESSLVLESLQHRNSPDGLTNGDTTVVTCQLIHTARIRYDRSALTSRPSSS